jgi:hypothetical protein
MQQAQVTTPIGFSHCGVSPAYSVFDSFMEIKPKDVCFQLQAHFKGK